MVNIDNKTNSLNYINLKEYKELIENSPCHIATVTKDRKPNLAVASDVKVIDKNILLISHNEMVNTPNNIIENGFVVITSFNKSWEGLRLTGNAKYYSNGEYFELCNKLFKKKNNIPKGAIVVEINRIEEIS